MNRLVGRDSAPGAGRGLGLTIAQNGIGKKEYDDSQLLRTDMLINEVTIV